MPLKPSHNLLVRGSNPCGGTKDIADFRLQIADFAWRDFEGNEGAIRGRDGVRTHSARLKQRLVWLPLNTEPRGVLLRGCQEKVLLSRHKFLSAGNSTYPKLFNANHHALVDRFFGFAFAEPDLNRSLP